MNDERTSVSQAEVVFRSQPHFKMCERTVPIKYLNSKSEGKAGKVEDLYNLILDSPKGTEKEEDDPKKMGQQHTICKNLVEHFLRPFPCGMIQQSTTGWYSLIPFRNTQLRINAEALHRLSLRGMPACGRQEMTKQSRGLTGEIATLSH
jgi:hypothetical protein